MELCTYKVTIKGQVQGVGFRPFVYGLSQRYLFSGYVSNDSRGVTIILNIDAFSFTQVLTALEYESPSLAIIDTINYEKLPFEPFDDFKIINTQEGGDISVNIPPDISICSQCEAEIFDTKNRRYHYPFISCTQCGVRYSIINELPYDRKNTSMHFFKMCKECESEYNNPQDRRYHAQPIGCFNCGPKLFLKKAKDELELEQDKIIESVVRLIQDGNIVAVKGVGGYHLVCDATNTQAVQKLRKRKQRKAKPFAVMLRNMQSAKELATISLLEEELLLSKERPIVLLQSKENTLSSEVAPDIKKVGIFLAYTPLHLLLLEKLQRPIVATSANVTDEPICTNLEDLERLEGVYDYVLEHDREILNACDDSVVMLVENQKVTLRRARGYAPSTIELPFSVDKNTLALGANQKSTVAIAYENKAILSPHIGDLNSIAAIEYYMKSIESLERIYKFKATQVIYDKHPQYESTKIARKLIAENKELESVGVQHHYAHILGVMAEKKIKGKVFGVAFDGTGYGEDGKLWGGEFLVCEYGSYERVGHLKYFKLLGGTKAIKEPKRVALSLLFDLYGEDVPRLENETTQSFTKKEMQTHYIAWKKDLNAPFSSSMGRVFDGVASLLGICHVMSFEGESGILLEEYYDENISQKYTFSFKNGLVDIFVMIESILKEKSKTIAVSKFFNTIIEIIAVAYKPYKMPLLVSGGVFQNRVLLKLLLQRFPEAIISNEIPPNDGGIALGQIAHSLAVE